MYEYFAKQEANRVAKRVRKALLEIPFYRQKLKQHGIDFSEVRSINTVEKLDAFFNNHRDVEWVSDTDLVNNDFSLKLSLAPQSKRIWVQSSSGYELATRFQCCSGEDLTSNRNLLANKEVAYTKNDLRKLINIVYKRGLDELVKNVSHPIIALFGTMGDMHGSGTFPLIGISGGYYNIGVKTLYFGIPIRESHALQYLIRAKNAKVCGVISNVKSMDMLVDVALKNDIKFENLLFTAIGGDPVPNSLIRGCHEVGAQSVIIGYSIQEVMPLGAIARGTISSNNEKIPPTKGLVVLGNLCFVRVTDKDGYSVDLEENGIIRVTSPFEGTTLIDYATHDIGKLIDLKTEVTYRGKSIVVPYPVLDWDIRRDAEHTLRVYRNNIPTYVLRNLCYESVKYNFLLATDSEKLYVFLRNTIAKERVQELEKKLQFFIPQEPENYLEIRLVPEQVLQDYVYPLNHHKPHNIVVSNEALQKLLASSQMVSA